MRARMAVRGGLVAPSVGLVWLFAALGSACESDALPAAEGLGLAAGSASAAGQAPGAVPADWWAKVQEGLAAENYRVTERAAALGADNPAQGFVATFDAQGLALGPLAAPKDRVDAQAGPSGLADDDVAAAAAPADVPEWALRLGYAGLARGRLDAAPGEPGRAVPVLGACPDPHATGATGACFRQVEYAHDAGVVEFFRNTERGVEHGFVLAERPAGDGELTVRVGYAGLDARAAGDAILFSDGAHDRVKYAELLVRDADGNQVPARMVLGPAEIGLVIDDREALYPLVIDPLATGPAWTATGELLGDLFSYSVASAGDVNGDGFGDVIVGARSWSSATGKAYVFHGSAAGLGATAQWTKTGEATNNGFGYSVASAGDVNGDGYADVIVGAHIRTTNTGKAYVFLGSPSGLGPDAIWSKDGEAINQYFGRSVASAGDVNGDGFADVIVGAEAFNSNAGKAYLFFGSAAGPSVSADWTKTGEATNNYFGYSVASAGDVNGDGFADIVVGAYGNSSSAGRAYVFHGSATGPGPSGEWFATGETASNRFGWSVASAGDVNGDGYADVIVGAYAITTNTGKAYVFHGSATGLSLTWNWFKSGEATSNQFGFSVASAGDVNGDGYADVIVGAPQRTTQTGKAYVFLGSAAGLGATATWTANGLATNTRYGHSVASAGDVNGDGFADVIVGAPGPEPSGFPPPTPQWGRAYLFLGSAGGLGAAAGWTATGEATDDYFGDSVASAGDVNGDGYGDVIVGADGFSLGTGRVYVFHGSAAGLSTTANWTMNGEAEEDWFGWSAAAAGDVNGDGYGDVIVGALGYSAYTGRAYLFLGSAGGLGATAAWTATGEATDDQFGNAVASAGDVNGDGFADVVVAAFGASTYTGRAYLFHGSATGLSTTADWTQDGEATYNEFGWSAASAGDVNSDGFADVIVGAPSYSGYTGRAYVYHGSAAGLSPSADWTQDGEAVDNGFGRAAASAGDVNGDGHADVIVGAWAYSSSTGRAYVYHGSAAGLNAAANWTVTGEGTGQDFGWSAASAGDVNGDRFADVIVAAPWYASGTGRAYVYHGSAAGLGTSASWTKDGEEADSRLGGALASAGDVNGDGYADVIVGAWRYSSNTGRAYVFYGNEGGGLSQNPRQGNRTLSTLVQPGASPDFLGIKLLLGKRTTVGRAKVKLQYEVKGHAVPFDGTGLAMTPAWEDSGIPSSPLVDITYEATGLSPDQVYHWRARLLYQSGGWSRWFNLGVGQTNMAFRVLLLANGRPCTAGGDCLSTNCVDGVCCTETACPECQACNVSGAEGTCQAVAGGTSCDDDVYCNGSDSCDGAGACTNHTGDPCPVPAYGADLCAQACNEDADDCTANAASGAPCGSDTADACTAADSCDGNGACLENHAVSGTACDDESFCNGSDTCDGAGACTNHAGDPCPVPAYGADFCATACNEDAADCTANAASGAPCGSDTADACTAPDSCDGSGVCLGNHADSGASCDDDTFCNGSDTCDGAGACTNHTGDPCPAPAYGADFCAAACSEAADDCTANAASGAPCGSDTADACNAPDSCDGSGACLSNFAESGTSCDDDTFCNGTDTCDGAGACASHAGDPCPAPAYGADLCAAACNEDAGDCTANALSGAPCGSDASDACTAPDSCDGSGVCLGNHADIGTTCDDESFCNGSDTCDGVGACASHVGNPCPGPDGDADCSESCDETADSCLLYDGDGAFCTNGATCQGGICCVHSGDVNADGVISSGDAQLAFFMSLGMAPPAHDPPWTAEEICLADCNGDGTVSSGDAQIIFLSALGTGGCVDVL